MKRIAALFLTLAMALSLIACSGNSDSGDNSSGNSGPAPSQSETLPDASSGDIQKIDSPSADLVIGTAGAGGTWYILGSAIANLVTKYTNINMTASSTNGTVENMRLTGAGRLDIGMTQPPADYDAVKGQDLFDGEAYENLRYLCGGHYSIGQIAVPADSDIKTIADLKGKRVAIGVPGSGVRHVVGNGLIQLGGVTLDDIQIISVNQDQGTEALQDGTADAAVYSGGILVSGLLNLSQSMDVRILSIPEDSIAGMEKTNPAMAAAMKYVTIPAGTYRGQTEDVLTAGFITAFTVNKDVSDDAVYSILEAIYQHSDELEEVSTSGAEYTLEEGLGKGCTITPHPGSVKWFADHGITLEDPLA
jgi:hypothetical protein